MAFSLPHFGAIEITGKDAKVFLQGQLTCDLEMLTPQNAILGGYCNAKGRLDAVFYLLENPNTKHSYFLILPRDLIAYLLDKFKNFGRFSKVTFACLPDAFFFGEMKEKSFQQFRVTWDEAGTTVAIEIPQSKRVLHFCMHHNHDAALSFDPNYAMWVEDELHQHMPWIHAQTIGLFLPHAVGLVEKGGVSFKKGCYLGQEILARLEYRTNPEISIRETTLTSAVAPGHEITLDEKRYYVLYALQTGNHVTALISDK